MFESATLRLTLWYLAIAMTISICFSSVIYSIATNELNRGLHRQSDRISAQIPDEFMPDSRLRFAIAPDSQAAANRLFWRLVALNLIVLAGAGYASYVLARRTLDPIEAAHEQQKRFTADVSHELRTPLTALKMESEVALLDKKAKPADLRKTIESNLEEANKLELLINNLLRLSRLEAGELQQQFTAVSNEVIVTGAIEQVRKQAEARNIIVEADVQIATLRGDQDSLQQLLIILLDNAIKFSPQGSTVRVASSAQANQAVITVADQGSGIAPAALDHIFDRFYQADSSRTKAKTSGYGLGLSIAKMIADVHEGTITITSKLKQGTTATIALPLHGTEDQPTQ